VGVGFGNYGAVYPTYALINWPDALGHAHNYYLNILAETGIIGLLAYAFLWGAIFVQTLRALRWQEWPLRGLLLGLLGVWTAITVHHLVDKLYVNNLYIHLGVLLGLLQLSSLRNPGQGLGDCSLEEIKG
jgi:O-antigen ligase